jgi:hypothetical protein
MSTVEEIETAIRSLRPEERERLVYRLPEVLPESDEEGPWKRIIRDARPRTDLTRLGDEIGLALKSDPEVFPEISDHDFDKAP